MCKKCIKVNACERKGFPGGSEGKDTGNVEYLGLIRGLGRSPGVANSNRLQYSCLEDSKDRGDWWAIESTGLQRAGDD